MILFLFFVVCQTERNFRKRAFHKQLLKDENKIVKTSQSFAVRNRFSRIYWLPLHTVILKM